MNVILFRQKITTITQQASAEQPTENEEEPSPTQTIIHSCQRTGCMAAFESFSQFESYFDEILDLVEDFSSTSVVSPKIMDAVENSDTHTSTSINVSLSDSKSQDDQQQPTKQLLVRFCLKFFLFL